MGKGLIDSLLDHIFDADWTGRRGEKLTERELNLVRLFGRRRDVRCSVTSMYLRTTVKHRRSTFCLSLEKKKVLLSLKVRIIQAGFLGMKRRPIGQAMLPNKEKNRFYNPIKQNKTHIKWLGQYLKEEIPLFSVIVFSERCELEKDYC